MKYTSLITMAAASLLAGQAGAQSAQFVPASSLLASGFPNQTFYESTVAVAGDMDGDADLDIVLGFDSVPATGSSIRLIRNGTPNVGSTTGEAYGAYTQLPSPSITRRDRIFDIHAFDADGDGDTDIVYVTDTVIGAPALTQVALLRQGPGGVFSAPQFLFASQVAVPITAEVVDMNGDGSLDVVVGTIPALGSPGIGPVILFNNGFGNFAPLTLGAPYAGMNTVALAVGDVDGDGDMDIVSGNRSSQGGPRQNVLYRNNNGLFAATTAGMPINTTDTGEVLLADINGTLLPELIVSDVTGIKQAFAGGAAGFGAAFATFSGPSGQGPKTGAAADVDLDGDIDLVFGSQTSNTQVVINTNGTLALAPGRSTLDGTSKTTQLVDLDRDGDLDVLHGGMPFTGQAGARIQTNLHRQIDCPYTAQIGSTYTIDQFDRPGYGNGFTPTFIFSPSALVPRVQVTSLGLLGVNSVGAVTATLAPTSMSMTSLSLPIPNNPGLIGSTWFWQFVNAPATGNILDWGFTNVVPLTFF